MAVFDVIGIASVMPFVAVLTSPEIIFENVSVEWLFLESSFLNDLKGNSLSVEFVVFYLVEIN